jgi:hypothetical protein
MTRIDSAAQLHARLLRLPRDDQQAVISGLPAWRRADLSAHIQAQQQQIETGEEPELEPLPAAGSSGASSCPSSPASASCYDELPKVGSSSVNTLFARARGVRQQLLAQQESANLASEMLLSAQLRARSTAARLGLPSSSSEASQSDDEEDVSSVSSEPLLRSSSFALRALLRYLAESPADTRQVLIKNLSRERRVDLFAYMLSAEGREVCGGAFTEEELLEPHLEDLKACQSSDDSEGTDESELDFESSHLFSPSQRKAFGLDIDETTSLGASDILPCSTPGAVTANRLESPATPSKQQLVFRPRNTMPLGALQVKHLTTQTPAPVLMKSAGRPSEAVLPKKNLEASGIDGTALRDWLCGRASGPLSHVRLLESMQWARFSGQKDAKQLSSTEDLYSSSVATGYGGPLGGMAGGVARAFAADVDAHLGGLFSDADGPERGLIEADAWVRRFVEDTAPESDRPSRQHLEGLDEEDINLAFRRRCVAVHPHRSGGDLEEYLKVHIYLEILRQWQEVSANPLLLSEKVSSRTGPGLNDHELSEELGKDHANVLEESKAADTEVLKDVDNKLSSHVLQLSWIKEKLEAELSFMRSRGAYTTLGVGPEASDAELARAYKLQALRLHPDRGGSTEAFQALQSAYERVLKQRGGESKKKKPEKEADVNSDMPADRPAEDNGDEKEADVNSDMPADRSPAEDSMTSASPGAEKNETHGAENEDPAMKEEPIAKEDSAVKEEPNLDSADDESKNAAEEVAPSEVNAEKEREDNAMSRLQCDVEDVPDSTAELQGMEQLFEGLEESESSDDIEDLEKFLTNAAAAIPAEVAAGQAEMALQGAHMCFRAVRLCSRALTVGPDAWPQLERLASHVLEAAQHVAEACSRISDYAGSVPKTVMPLLDVVSKRSACLREAMVRQVIKGTTGLLQSTERISSMSQEVTLRQSALMQHSSAVLDMLRGLLGRTVVPLSVCDGMHDVLQTVARLAREAAEAGAAASTTIGEAQRHAENLVEVLGAAGLWEENDEEGKEKKSKKNGGGKEDGDGACSDDSDDDKEPWEQHVEWISMLQKLNGEVLALQKELRQLVNADPALIAAVTPVQKEALFSIVAELLAQARQSVSRAWYAQWVTDESSSKSTSFPELVEVALSCIVSASYWQSVAVPSVDARLLRLAALVDCGLLCAMLQEDLFAHTLQLASKEEVPLLESRFTAIAQAMTVGFASG